MGPRVLLLDEDAPFIAEAQSSLESIGCEVTALRSGDSGLARAVTDRFDLVIASAELPSVNGFRLCNRVKKDPAMRNVPVLLLTGPCPARSAAGARRGRVPGEAGGEGRAARPGEGAREGRPSARGRGAHGPAHAGGAPQGVRGAATGPAASAAREGTDA